MLEGKWNIEFLNQVFLPVDMELIKYKILQIIHKKSLELPIFLNINAQS